jgi:O-antigen ligase
MPVWLALLLSYPAVSILWSNVPAVAFVRYSEFALVVAAVAAAISVLPPRAFLAIAASCLSVIILVDLLSVFLVPAAIHRSPEVKGIIGAWRGIHPHKNYAGPVAAACAMLAVLRIKHRVGRFSYDLGALALSVVFLFGSQSKTAMGVAALSVATSILFNAIAVSVRATGTLVSLALVLVVAVAALSLNWWVVADLLSDPEALTGRVELWNALFPFIGDHLWTGVGFGSFWRIGPLSPIIHLTNGWGATTGEAHNSYIEVVLALGLPGLAIATWSYVWLPIQRAMLFPQEDGFVRDCSLAFLMYGLLSSATESSLLVANHPVFFLWTGAVCLIGVSHTRTPVAVSRSTARTGAANREIPN